MSLCAFCGYDFKEIAFFNGKNFDGTNMLANFVHRNGEKTTK